MEQLVAVYRQFQNSVRIGMDEHLNLSVRTYARQPVSKRRIDANAVDMYRLMIGEMQRDFV